MTELADMEFNPPRGGSANPLKGPELTALHDKLGNEWQLVGQHHLEKTYNFGNFQEALDYTVKIGALAESVDHHPEICLSWGWVKITLWTHSIDGLSEADFVFCARVDRLDH